MCEYTCHGCLKIGNDVRMMSPDEQNLYFKFVQASNEDVRMFVCLLCAHLLKKLGKFLFQCQEAYNILSHSLLEETKPEIFSKITLHRLITTEPHVTEFYDNPYNFEPELVSFDDAFDDEDVPLVLLKKEDGLETEDRVKKKKKLKKKHVDENGSFIKIEDLQSESLDKKEYKKIKCKRKPKKELPEGFSSRMVQETEEYVVIKLTKEQVLEEMQERSKREEYQRTLFKCEKCVKGFNFEDVLRTHMEKHSMENGSLQCEICTQYCPSVVSLRGHMKSHTTRYKCKVCGCVRQSRQHLLEHHSTSHTAGALTYTCHHCDFSTTKRTSMQRHVKSHRQGEKHACHQCGKLFKSEETLRVHTMRHDKSKRLQCEECNRMFIYPSLLHRHVQAVHVRKDYYCVECDVEFKSRENLRLHFKKAKRHRDASSYQYECSQCAERFVSPSTLSTHVTSAHGSQKQHECGACARAYSSRDALRAHARAKHCRRADKVQKKLEDSMLAEVPQPALLES
ncbi:hypothetical protein ABMA28_012477 [Loxostege sticticalis]|uniref:C2H2-type domain-containing protein n=1 Tax=Loxostege sticticalis TaxID=481309 RepID=A0ABD0S686_LOXSC